MYTEIIDAERDISGGYKVDVSRGANVDRVSSECFARPDDERYLSLADLFASVKGRAERSRTRTVESAAIRVEAHRDDPEKLSLVLPGTDEPIAPTHWSFGQLSSLVGAPAAYLRQRPAPLAGINLQYGLTNHRAEQIKNMEVANGRTELRAVTGPMLARFMSTDNGFATARKAGSRASRKEPPDAQAQPEGEQGSASLVADPEADRFAHGSHIGAPYLPKFAREPLQSSMTGAAGRCSNALLSTRSIVTSVVTRPTARVR